MSRPSRGLRWSTRLCQVWLVVQGLIIVYDSLTMRFLRDGLMVLSMYLNVATMALLIVVTWNGRRLIRELERGSGAR